MVDWQRFRGDNPNWPFALYVALWDSVIVAIVLTLIADVAGAPMPWR